MNLYKKKFQLLYAFVIIITGLLLAYNGAAQKIKVKKQFAHAAIQANYMLAVIDSARANGSPADLVAPRSIEKGKIKLVKGQDWTSGFFPGELWFLYEYTGNKE